MDEKAEGKKLSGDGSDGSSRIIVNRGSRANSTPLKQSGQGFPLAFIVQRGRSASQPDPTMLKMIGKPKSFALTETFAHGNKHTQSIVQKPSYQGEVIYVDPWKRPKCGMCADPIQEQDDRLSTYPFQDDGQPRLSEIDDTISLVVERVQDNSSKGKPPLSPIRNSNLEKIPSNNLQIVPAANESTMVSSAGGYGYGSAAWEAPPTGSAERSKPVADYRKRALSRKIKYSASQIGPYRILVAARLICTIGFLQFRVTTPTEDGYWLWLVSVMCELWFFFSWMLDSISKITPVRRETYKDRLQAVYDDGGESFPQVDVFITTADSEKEPPLVTACTILSVLSTDYPANRLACYLSDDGASKLMFDTMAEISGFAQLWLPFCKRFSIEPRNPDAYFSESIDFTEGKVQPDFVKSRRKVKREFEEFKVRVNALVADSKRPPTDGWQMKDGTFWPGNNRRNHDGIIQVFLHPDGDLHDVEGGIMPPLVYVSREKRPGIEHNKKAGAMNALLRASGLITSGTFLLNLDCDHFVNNSQAIREALCFFLDPIKGKKVGYVQFPQRFDGIDKNDRYANRNTVFFDINMKGLDGQQGPVYVGTGCMFRRKALYGFHPQERESSKTKREGRSLLQIVCNIFCFCCNLQKTEQLESLSSLSDEDQSKLIENAEPCKPINPLRMGTSKHFIETAMPGWTRTHPLNPHTMLSEVILTISADYEDNTDWGKEIGWMYGSVTEDILTGMKIHTLGWCSVYCDPQLAAFKGSAPLNITDRLHQVERWAAGAVEIFLSSRNPLWAEWGTRLKLRQRIAYANNAFYPFTSLAIFAYCLLGPLALMTDLFFVPTLSMLASIWFAALIFTVVVGSLLELQWSGVTFDAWWRNEQFWVISGISAHLAAVVQGILKLIAGVEINFTLTSKGSDNKEVDGLHSFKFTWLLLFPAFVLLFNVVGIIMGIARAATKGKQWGSLAEKLVFSFWTLIHLYPFSKGMLGRRDRLPTVVLVWCVLLLITVSLLWTTFA
ncbi:hypothetical protein O6H91_01G026100 [Diphasiastrum complanatum]|uniref:Uncharacterized protein n=2 Tax=Diphasiastrum complanatum TaxID=34168 RepID=A0ACC2EP71_DIPCM|nr:hypothetical protein O6H91_01G026100 [Diphasiastrum complanatum]KAJ7568291.1 hypothetical protein O6H91_01G026100 [Diphasiastrum complanatum]